MYRISELAQRVGLSRSTLLYYEKLGLICGARQSNGYRRYSERDLQRLKLLQQLQAGGLSLKECLACLEAKVDRETLLQRLNVLDEEIAQKQKARALLSSMLGLNSMRDWHQSLEHSAPEAHLDWLMKQGFSEKHALRLKWLSKDMNEHQQYMADFEGLFEGLDHLGPSSQNDSLKALQSLPSDQGHLLDIGCGKGVTSLLLAQHSQFDITALDNDEYSLSCLAESLRELGLEQRITMQCASMTDMPFEAELFDVLWSEGSAYIMGFEQALQQWRQFIKSDGYLVVSDLVWLTDQRSQEAEIFWQQNYPQMSSVQQREAIIEKAGYRLMESFTLSKTAWDNYLQPLTNKVSTVKESEIRSNALVDIKTELNIHQQFLGQYGYQMFVLKKLG
ncbi:MerR family transcriptional regulator [Vibrio sp. LaRot3]|uniref:MerR family transcriptional regulator n=1 Tax=Vibrio sp. LaRot3 TaxID=2998829 RepID=UPI0022CDC5E3|nr:MerR family transcriptional regulator [Vibrio sp. LaRot3]MDA0149814.1 MerR family transcriptional regulator [Vibrio sp. LaRot3]